jgi:hypothetical protein
MLLSGGRCMLYLVLMNGYLLLSSQVSTMALCLYRHQDQTKFSFAGDHI